MPVAREELVFRVPAEKIQAISPRKKAGHFEWEITLSCEHVVATSFVVLDKGICYFPEVEYPQKDCLSTCSVEGKCYIKMVPRKRKAPKPPVQGGLEKEE